MPLADHLLKIEHGGSSGQNIRTYTANSVFPMLGNHLRIVDSHAAGRVSCSQPSVIARVVKGIGRRRRIEAWPKIRPASRFSCPVLLPLFLPASAAADLYCGGQPGHPCRSTKQG